MNNPTQIQLQNTLQLANMAAWEWNFVTGSFTRSELHDHLFGYPDGIKNWDIETFQKLIHPADFGLLEKTFRDVIDLDERLEAEFRVTWPDETTHWLWTRGIVTERDGRKPVRMSGVTMDITSRKQAELEAKKYRRQLEEAQKIAKLGYGEFNYKTGHFFWSDTVYQLFGLDRNRFELTIENFYKMLPVHEHKEYIRLFEHSKDSGQPFDHIFALEKPNGETGYFRERAEFIKNDMGELEKVNGIILDVTDQEQVKRELKESQNLLEKTQNLARIGYWEYDYRDQTLEWSDKVYQIFGLNPGTFEVTYDHFMELVHPDDRINLKTSQEQGLNSDTLFESEYRLIKSDGTIGYFQERGEFIKDKIGKPLKLTGAVIDITTLKQAEQQLLESERTYRLLFQHNPLPSFIYDFETLAILEVNQAAVKHYGYSKEEFESLTIEDIHRSEDLPKLHRKLKKITTTFSNSGQITHVTKNGKHIEVEVISVSLQYGGRNCRRVVINDITEQIRKQQENLISMIEGEDRERKRIAMDLHDSLAQYLTAASMNLSSVKNQIAQWPAKKRQQFETGLSLLKDALHESRNIAQNLMPKAIEDFGLIPALQDLFHKIEQTHNVSIDFHHDIVHITLKRQVEINLYRITQEALSNTLKHSGADRIEIRIVSDEKNIFYLFHDNGHGFQAKNDNQKHRGLGLSNMKMRAHSMLATLNINGLAGNGITITSKIPV